MNRHIYLRKFYLIGIFCLTLITLNASNTPRWRVAVQGLKNTEYYKSIAVINDDTIYILLNTAKVLKTIDGGQSWTSTNLPTWVGTNLQPRAICFPTSKVGYVAGDNNIAKTTDYGKTWTMLTTTPTGTLGMTSIVATNENICYFGATSKVYYTTDGGATFSNTSVGVSASSLFITPEGTIFRAGGSGGIYKSTDAALTFTANLNTGSYVKNTIPSIYFSDNSIGYAVGLKTTSPYENNIIKTTDGGATWSGYALGSVSTINTKGANAVCIPTTGDGYVVGTVSNAAGDTYIRKTTDAGLTFSIDTIGASITDYYAVSITPRGDVYVAGNGCVLTRKLVGVTTQVNNNDMGSVTGAGVYYAGETVTLTAAANQGYEFEKWTVGTSDISNQPVYSFTAMSTLHAIQAVFKISTATSAYPQKSTPAIYIHGKEIRYEENTGVIDVYDVTGKLIVSKNSYAGIIQLNESGIYIIKIKSSQDVKAQKIILR